MRHITIPVKTNEINIYPINDVQVGGMGVDERRFSEYIKTLGSDPIGHGLGLGDYCVTVDTPVLTSDLRWVPAGLLEVGDKLVGFDEEIPEAKQRRRFQEAIVLSASRKNMHVFGVHLADGTILRSTDEHRWLVKHKGSYRWERTDQIAEKWVNGRTTILSRFFNVTSAKQTYSTGYLAAAFDGEGFFGALTNGGVRCSMAQRDNAMLDTVVQMLTDEGYDFEVNTRETDDVLEVRLRGGRANMMRFMMETRPKRLIEKWRTQLIDTMVTQSSDNQEVVYVEDLGEQEIAAISSSSKTYIANGFGAHNTDGLSPSNRAAIKSATNSGNWYDVGERMLLEAATRQADRFIKLALPAAGKYDAFLKGHHFYEYKKIEGGKTILTSTDIDIAEALGAPYLDDTSDKKQMAMITYKGTRGRQLRVLALHGEGSGSTLASPLSRLTRLMASFQADVYMIAHHHKVFATRVPVLRSDGSRSTHLAHRDALLVACGSWMRGYVEDETTYAEAGIMAPLAIGAPIIHAKMKPGFNELRVTV